MKDLLIIALVIGVYFMLQLYILPKLGISTWMRKACQGAGKTVQEKVNIEAQKNIQSDISIRK